MSGLSRPPTSYPELSVSVVTHNSALCLPRFLDSLRPQTHASWEIYFFDNASGDETPRILRNAGLGELDVNATNIGYGRAHNRNLARCRGEYVLLMNPDLEFGPYLFAALLEHLRAHPEHALVGPSIVEGPAKEPFPPRRFYPGEGMIALDPGMRRNQIAWLNGCCIMLRRNVLEALGGFDTDYFLYQEETDLCLRARRAGHRIGHAPGAIVHHLHRQSQRDLSDYEYARRIFQGSAIFWEKHYPRRDVLRMVRFQYWASRLLLAFIPLTHRLSKWPAALSEPRLKARHDICTEWLSKRGLRPAGLAGLPGKIALRQIQVMLLWLLQREFPLDDF